MTSTQTGHMIVTLGVVVLLAGCPRTIEVFDASAGSDADCATIIYRHPGCDLHGEFYCGPLDLCQRRGCSCTGKVIFGCEFFGEPWTTDLVVDPLRNTCVPADGGVTPQNCAAIIDCTRSAQTQKQYDQCVSAGAERSQMLFQALDSCIVNACGSLRDGGTGPCGTVDTCVSCVQTGMGKTQSNGMCVATFGGSTVSDPHCGQCVDQRVACANDP